MYIIYYIPHNILVPTKYSIIPITVCLACYLINISHLCIHSPPSSTPPIIYLFSPAHPSLVNTLNKIFWVSFSDLNWLLWVKLGLWSCQLWYQHPLWVWTLLTKWDSVFHWTSFVSKLVSPIIFQPPLIIYLFSMALPSLVNSVNKICWVPSCYLHSWLWVKLGLKTCQLS